MSAEPLTNERLDAIEARAQRRLDGDPFLIQELRQGDATALLALCAEVRRLHEREAEIARLRLHLRRFVPCRSGETRAFGETRCYSLDGSSWFATPDEAIDAALRIEEDSSEPTQQDTNS